MEFLKVKRRRKSSIVLCMAIWHCMHFHNYSFNISHKLARNLLTIIAFIMLQTLGNFSPYSRTFSFLISESFFSILTPELIHPNALHLYVFGVKKCIFLPNVHRVAMMPIWGCMFGHRTGKMPHLLDMST